MANEGAIEQKIDDIIETLNKHINDDKLDETLIQEVDTTLTNAATSAPKKCLELLEAIYALPATTQADIGFQPKNILATVIKNFQTSRDPRENTANLEKILRGIQALDDQDKAFVLSQSAYEGKNLLMKALESGDSKLFNRVFAIINSLHDERDRSAILNHRTDPRSGVARNALLFALEHLPEAIGPLVKAGLTLNSGEKNHLASHLSTIMYICHRDDRVIWSQLLPCLKGIASLPNYQDRKDILSAYAISARKTSFLRDFVSYKTVDQVISELKDLNLSTKYLILSQEKTLGNEHKGFANQLKQALNDMISNAVKELNDQNPIEHALKQRLESMSHNADEKKVLILEAYQQIKSQYEDHEVNEIDAAVNEAIEDRNSPLYQAFHTKRFSKDGGQAEESKSFNKFKQEIQKHSPKDLERAPLLEKSTRFKNEIKPSKPEDEGRPPLLSDRP